MTYVLLTRPEEDCQELKTKLIVPTISSPLLKVIQKAKRVALPEGVTDLIATSARVFEMISNIKSMITIPVWCVGEATATAAKAAGFEKIFQVNRSAQEILERIVNECPKESSHFAHIGGAVVHVDLAEALVNLGFKADRIIIYETEAAQSLSQEAETVMQAGLIQQMPFFSLRTAEIFVDIAKKSEWADKLRRVTALAHSEAIARSLRQISWKEVIVVPDLSAQRIVDYYKRPGDSSMKQRPFIGQLLATAAVAAVVSMLIVSLWPASSLQDLPSSVKPEDLQVLTKEIASIKANLKIPSELEEKIQHLSENLAQLQKEMAEQKVEKPSVPLIETPKPTEPFTPPVAKDSKYSLRSLQQELTTGSVRARTVIDVNKHLPLDQQLPQSVISVRDLLDQLQALPNLKREINLEVDNSLWQKAINSMGLRVRKTEITPLKEQAVKGLKRLDFSFLGTLDIIALPSEWALWVKECHQTRNVLASVSTHLDQDLSTPPGDYK
ncbi:MAG: uroporphyrinogen-III synthase [Candidatus Paracaedibacteraceae bacterium]|nr:uroporphyrinogen-III synthase [Candidatus Paracaedibacteraceae bacterium]